MVDICRNIMAIAIVKALACHTASLTIYVRR